MDVLSVSVETILLQQFFGGICSTVIRVPFITGFPIIIEGSVMMISLYAVSIHASLDGRTILSIS